MLRFSDTTSLSLFRSFSLLAITFALTAIGSHPQAQKTRGAGAGSGEDDTPPLREYRGVSIGMLADDVRKKLGSPSDKGEEQDFFVFGDNETAQVVYDKTHTAVAISFDFMTGAREVPTAKAIFGADVEAKPDGSIYKMVRYPKAGYWLSYNRTAGASPLTSVTLQRIEH